MGLFSGKNQKNAGRADVAEQPSKAQGAPSSASRVSSPAGSGADTKAADNTAERSSLAANMKKLTKGSGASADSNKRGSDRASQDRGAKAPTGGNTVATIGKSIIIKGDLSGDEDLIIEGKVEGRVQLPNNEITVGADGRITADIEAKAIIVVGQTAGNLNATQRVEIQATGTVNGDIASPSLNIQEGATVNGSISMTKSAASAKTSDNTGATPIGEQARKSA